MPNEKCLVLPIKNYFWLVKKQQANIQDQLLQPNCSKNSEHKVGIGRDSNSPSLHFFELRDELGQRAPLVRVLGPSLQDQLLQVFREIVRDIRSLPGHGGRQNLRTDDVGLI